MSDGETECSFCGRDHEGGLASVTAPVYICPICIELGCEIVKAHEGAGDAEVASAEQFEHPGSVTMVDGRAYWDAAAVGENLAKALKSRETIAHAVGIVMSGGGRTAEDAFAILKRKSQRENRKLREVAAEVVARTVRTERPARPVAPPAPAVHRDRPLV
jgi:hypothetical protein